jgi:hypothetical protein
MNRPLAPLLCSLLALVFTAPPSSAQLALPGATPAASKGTTDASKPKSGRPANKAAATKAGKPAALAGIASLVGQPLLLNGKSGLLQISGDDKSVTIDKLRFAGEGVSDPSQRCAVDIVGEKPIQATSVGRPDGLERFEADVPACPFAFDVLNGSVLVPPQITACVFKAADCQTSPTGLWGPDGPSLVTDAPDIEKERAQAEKTMAKVVQAIQERANDNADMANLARDQTAFAGQRDDACRDYVKESVYGYCALRVTEAHTALLQARLDALGPEHPAKQESEKSKNAKAKKSTKAPAP